MTPALLPAEATTQACIFLEHLLPAAARLLEGHGYPPDAPPLHFPPDPEHLPRVGIDALRALIPAAVWKALLAGGGVLALPRTRPGGEGIAPRRLWEDEAVALRPLAFTEHAVTLFLAAYNVTRVPLGTHGEAALRWLQRLHPAASGDALLHLFLILRLRGRQIGAPALKSIAANPLVRLALPHQLAPAPDEAARLARLLEPDLAPYLPWLFPVFLREWRIAEPQRWGRDVAAFTSYAQRQGALFTAWREACTRAGRPDALALLLAYGETLLVPPTRAAALLDRFRALTAPLRHTERQDAADHWGATLRLPLHLHAEAHRLRAIPPIDREPAEALFLHLANHHHLDAQATAARSVLGALLPEIG